MLPTLNLLKLVARSAIALALVAAMTISPMRPGNGFTRTALRRNFAVPAKHHSRVSVSSVPSSPVRMKALSSESEEELHGTISPVCYCTAFNLTPSPKHDRHLKAFGLNRDHHPLRC